MPSRTRQIADRTNRFLSFSSACPGEPPSRRAYSRARCSRAKGSKTHPRPWEVTAISTPPSRVRAHANLLCIGPSQPQFLDRLRTSAMSENPSCARRRRGQMQPWSSWPSSFRTGKGINLWPRFLGVVPRLLMVYREEFVVLVPEEQRNCDRAPPPSAPCQSS